MKRVVKTICQMCYFYCGLDVTVEDGNIRRIDGTAEHPVTMAAFAPKGSPRPNWPPTHTGCGRP
jgi:anaerobic selenocysteine-containing dehydrogenase